LKIVIYINSLTSGGAERFASYLASHLAHCGEDVVVLTMKSPETDYFVLDGKVRRLHMANDSNGPFLKTRRCYALRSVIKAENADVLVGVQTTNAVLSVLAGMMLPTKVVVCERNYPAINKVGHVYWWLRKILYRFADLSIAQTDKAAVWLRENTKMKSVVVIPNPVSWPLPVTSPHIDPATHLNPDDKCLLAVGSLSKIHQKGFDLLISAFDMLAEHYPDWKLVILGSDQQDNTSEKVLTLKGQIESQGLKSRIVFPGRAGNVSDWYALADLFVLSSRYEGMPNVLLEAMACGCACVAFDCDTGPRDIIKHGVNGVLVPAGNVKALADAMEALMRDTEKRMKLGKAALDVREQFASEKILQKWRAALHSVLSSEQEGS